MATRYSPARELRALERESEKLRAIQADPYQFGQISDKREFYKRLKQIDSNLQIMSPPPIKDEAERGALETRAEQLKGFIVSENKQARLPAMPSYYDSWNMRAGVTGQTRRWNDKVNNWNLGADGKPVRSKYGAAHEYKDIQTRLVPRDEQEVDPDFRSLEKLRPENRSSTASEYRTSSFAPGAGIPEEKWVEAVGPKEEKKAAPKERKSREVPIEAQCKMLKKDGSACTGRAMKGQSYCMAHRPR